MSVERSEDFFVAMLIVVVGMVLGGLGLGVVDSMMKSDCLAAGYPEAKMSWKLDRYCIKRVNQTDVVIPFGEIKK